MITVFTPTYNRSELLKRVYESLKKQTISDFEWIVVDDGSTDNTKDLVNSWINKKEIPIIYSYQNNSGKHVAFNSAVLKANGNLFVCVDSDDFLPENAIELIYEYWQRYKNEKTAGLIGLKSLVTGEVIGDKMPKGLEYSGMYDLFCRHNCKGEKTLVFSLEILKENPYPVIEGEHFMGETVLYDRLDKKYCMVVVNKILTICEYQPGGLTNNIFINMLANPTGYKIYHKQRIDIVNSIRERINHIIRYNAFKILSKDKKYNYEGKYKTVVNLMMPIGMLLTFYYKLKKRVR